jgi:hypothetical protein
MEEDWPPPQPGAARAAPGRARSVSTPGGCRVLGGALRLPDRFGHRLEEREGSDFHEDGIAAVCEGGDVGAPQGAREAAGFDEQFPCGSHDGVEGAGRGGAVAVRLAGDEVGGADGEGGLDVLGGMESIRFLNQGVILSVPRPGPVAGRIWGRGGAGRLLRPAWMRWNASW